jgi:hypothetical protein
VAFSDLISLQGQLRQRPAGRVAAAAREVQSSFRFEHLHLPETYAEMWCRQYISDNPELFHSPYASEQRKDRVEREVRKLVSKKLTAHLQSLHDLEATEDAMAVTFSVRGGPHRPPPADAPNFARMGNKEFVETVQRDFGYWPGRLE